MKDHKTANIKGNKVGMEEKGERDTRIEVNVSRNYNGVYTLLLTLI